MADLTRTSLVELARMIAAGEASSREVVAAHFDRIDAVDPVLNAVTVSLRDRALAQAEAADEVVASGEPVGPLHGVPVTIKDQFLVEDTPSTWGLPSRATHRAEREGPLLHRLRAAGAIPIAKSNIPVLLIESETHNPLYGRTSNPWDLDRTPGGSSGGEGALISARCSPLGMGGDIGGSLRIPAHFCGITTIKVTPGQLPHGDNPEEEFPPWQHGIVDVAGPLARTVTDLTLGLRVMDQGSDPLPPEPGEVPAPWRDPEEVDMSGLRVGYYEADSLFTPAPAIRRAVREAAEALEEAGAEVQRWDPPDADEVFAIYASLMSSDGWKRMREWLGDNPKTPMIQLLTVAGSLPGRVTDALATVARAARQKGAAPVLESGGALSAHEVADLRARQDEVNRRLARRFDDGPSVILGPPSGLPALHHGRFRDLLIAASATFLPNLTGVPAGIVPVTLVRPDEESDRKPGLDITQRLARSVEEGSAGLPVGVQVMAPWWREDLVLAAMAAIEQGVEGVGEPTVPGVD